MDSVSFQLQPRPLFSFRLACEYLMGSPGTVLERVEPGRYRRALIVHGEPVLIAVSEAPLGGLQVTVSGKVLTGEGTGAAGALVAHVFQTAADVSGLEDAGAPDPLFARLIREYRGLRPVLLPTAFEALIWAVLGQQVNVAFAAKTKRALAQRYGGRFATGEETFLLFPDAETLAGAELQDLLGLQLSRQKARYVHEIATLVANGGLDLDRLGAGPPEEAEAALQQLVGVGRWTAEYVLMRGFGDRDSIPAGDGGLRQIIGRAYGLGRNATEDEVRSIALAWAGWRAYGAFYWWFRLQGEKAGSVSGWVHTAGEWETPPPAPAG